VAKEHTALGEVFPCLDAALTGPGLGRTHLARALWPYDKHPDLPQLTAGARVTLLDAVGPGVVVNLHASRFGYLDDVLEQGGPREPDAVACPEIEITYDHAARPQISLPLADFLGDPAARAEVYATRYFARVWGARNLRLPIPFAGHLRIDLANPSATDLVGYVDCQWQELPHLPEGCGRLGVDYRTGTARFPEDVVTLCDIRGPGVIAAHWLTLATGLDEARDGEYLCEGNQEFYLDGSPTPQLEYLGTEDVYGFSWGIKGPLSDGYAAIIRHDTDDAGLTTVGLLRSREVDRITFASRCEVRLDHTAEFYAAGSANPLHAQGVFARRPRASYEASYRSCFYYYA
jgi:hypothetical protein